MKNKTLTLGEPSLPWQDRRDKLPPQRVDADPIPARLLLES